MDEMMRKLFPEAYINNNNKDNDESNDKTDIDNDVFDNHSYSTPEVQVPVNTTIKVKTTSELLICRFCGRSKFKSAGGKTNHEKSCAKKYKTNSEEPSKNSTACTTSVIEEKPTSEPKVWGNHTLSDLSQIISAIYNEITKWRKNIFKIPSGAAGKRFVEETTRLLNEWNNKSPLGNIALKTMFLMPTLLLQKPNKTSKAKEHINCLERRLNLWFEGDFDELVRECRAIQSKLSSSSMKRTASITKRFSDLMFLGKVNAALKLLSNEATSGIVTINDEIMKTLSEKHPNAQPKFEELLIQGPVNDLHPAVFNVIDAELIQKMAAKTRGSSGPSQLDSYMWHRLLLSKSFGERANDLCKAVARMARILCTEKCDEENGWDIEAFLSCTLVPLNKNSGVRPIGIGEVLRRIVGKSITNALKDEIQEAAGNLQLCAGQLDGCEAAVHAMSDIFEEEETEAVLLVDATNAFNSINRLVMVQNIKVLCPSISIFVENCYSKRIRLFAIGGVELKSVEGTTQGDPIAMALYGISLIPLMNSLKINAQGVKQVAFADDLTGAGKIRSLRMWWQNLVNLGPKIGYFPKPSKSYLIVKPKFAEFAEREFDKTSINITTKGHKHLGAMIGNIDFRNEYVSNKVTEWVEELNLLSKIAITQPQVAYVAFIVGYRQKFNYVFRTIKDIKELLLPIENIIRYKLIPALCDGRNCNDIERQLLSLPIKMGGLGIINVLDEAHFQYATSFEVTDQLRTRIVAQSEEKLDIEISKKILKCRKEKRNVFHATLFTDIHSKLPSIQQKALEIARSQGASAWLTTLPLKDENYVLNKQEFFDALYMRYAWCMKRLPVKCACQANFSIDHALSCHLGGFIIQRHNNIRDAILGMMKEVCHDVVVEPSLLDATMESQDLPSSSIKGTEARADISANGFWIRYQRAFFDVKVCNLTAPSYREKSINTTLSTMEKQKKRAYNQRIQCVDKGTFTPLIFGATGGVARECSIFLSKLADKHAFKQKCNKSEVMACIRRKLSFVLIRSIVACLRGERTSRSFSINQLSLNDQKLTEILASTEN